MGDTDTKMLQNPQVRALDNQKATLKIGERVPVATGSFQPGIGGVGINPLVNTQFQYLDVGVNIDVTPHVHADREITLKITMEISSVVGQSSIGGISQPIIGQKKIEHEIRLKDGESSLIGGILDDSQTKSLSGIPGLAQIPILRYLFGQSDAGSFAGRDGLCHHSAHYSRNHGQRIEPAGDRYWDGEHDRAAAREPAGCAATAPSRPGGPMQPPANQSPASHSPPGKSAAGEARTPAAVRRARTSCLIRGRSRR